MSQNNFNDHLGETTQFLGKSIAPMSRRSSSSYSPEVDEFRCISTNLNRETKEKIMLRERRVSEFSFQYNMVPKVNTADVCTKESSIIDSFNRPVDIKSSSRSSSNSHQAPGIEVIPLS